MANATVERTQNMVLYFIASRGLKKIEGREFTLRLHKNSQDSVHITDGGLLPMFCRELDLRIPGRVWEEVLALFPEGISNVLKLCVRDERPNNEAIKLAVGRSEELPGAQIKRGIHLRVA